MKEKIQSTKTRLAALRCELAVVGSPDRTARLALEGQCFVAEEKPRIAGLKDAVRADYAYDFARHTGAMPPENVEPVDEACGTCRALLAAGAAVLVLDLGCGAFLGAFFLNFALATAVAIGVLLSLVVSMVTAAAWRAILVTDNDCPGKNVKLLRRQMKVIVPLYLACLVSSLLIGRVISAATPSGTAVFACLLTSLSVLGPMLLAVMILLADKLAWARKHVDQFQEISDLELEMDELEQMCKVLVVSPAIRQLGQPRLAFATTAVLLLVCCGADAKASECGSLWVDSSGSVIASSGRRQATSSAFALLPVWLP